MFLPVQAAVVIGLPNLDIPEVHPGELLLGELNCVACHHADPAVHHRLLSRASPRLGPPAPRVTPQFLRAFLSDPQAVKPGTTMPGLLHTLPLAERGDTVEALTHFLRSLHSSPDPDPAGSDPFKMREGQSLYHQAGCVACHGPQVNSAANPATSMTPLGDLARKYTVEALASFLVDPLAARPSGRMPSLGLNESEARSIAMYLLRDQTNSTPQGAIATLQGLGFEYFEAGMDRTDAIANLRPVLTGRVDQFTLAPKRRNENIAFRFTGQLRIPRDGRYTFYTASDDGTRLFLGDRLVVDNDGTHGTVERQGALDLIAGNHPIMLLWFNAGGPAELRVAYEGPGLEKQPIPVSALSYEGRPMIPTDTVPFELDPVRVALGRQRFDTLGCASCHSMAASAVGPARPATALAPPPLLALNLDSARGCLAESPAPDSKAPRFDLDASQRRAIRAALAQPNDPSHSIRLSEPRSSREQIAHTMAALNCYACHARDGAGGPTLLTAPFFTTAAAVDLGDEGRFPPHLTGVGAKLRPEWLRTVLVDRGSVRPYMATRMPQFGEANVGHLAQAFLHADAAPSPPRNTDPVPAADIKFGRAMVGTGGFSCVACHTFGAYASLGIPAMDLTQMTHRLNEDWFRRYLVDPQSLRPGTRMPSFWPGGQSLREDILQGDTPRQIGAIWAYLDQARTGAAGIPQGLIQGKMEIVPDQEPVVYRGFIHRSGTRGIGVGYPGKANLVFDANELRLTLLWHGPFIDAAQHRTGRGAGSEGPLGYNVLDLPAGPPFAKLPTGAAPWPPATGRDAGYRMLGYVLDNQRNPTFRYTFNGIEITETPEAVPGELESSIRRVFRLETNSPPNGALWFRAWTASSIESQSDGSYLADRKVEIRFDRLPKGGQPLLRQSGGGTELLLEVPMADGRASFIQHILW